MDLNGKRVCLNFGYNDRAFDPAPNNRTYPTTPSNPQPNYTTPGTQDYVGTQDSPYGQGYFVPSHYPQQAQFTQPQYARPNMSSPQPVYQPGMGHNGNNDTNDFIQQFSNQHLNSNRAGSPAQRSRTASGFPASQLQPKHLVPPVPRTPRPPSENEKLERYPERYSENIHKRGKAAKELVSVFFNESIEHARDRNTR